MVAASPQAIAGVSAGSENILRAVYPSICAWGPGRFIGRCLDLSPVRIAGIRVTNLLIGPLAVGPALLLYLMQKATGEKYVLTNRHVQRWGALGGRLVQQVELEQIADIAIDERPGQGFYHAADLHLMNEQGNTLMLLEGVPRADIFRATILKSRQARTSVQKSLAAIRARG